jgi:glycosyltransferase involved in cell wall biosynthesis
MPRKRLYYALKPFLPWRLRIAARQMLASGIRRANRGNWPVLESAARTPAGWPGWSEGKQFSFVLTHDVEGPEGLAKCRKLAELEMELGFRSCFNFIPEGNYAVPPGLRAWLAEQGFEVGVHDLHHDGSLYYSRDAFRSNAAKINRYLRDWGAVGFRSGFMRHNLDWIHDLDIGYDCSTFDTDPFEPQPDGAGTIFPFWVPANGHGGPRSGYVELPYSLAQDSTLFLILRERSPEIWTRKLDWIARNGGMALVNVHPDYMCFDGEKPSSRTYAAALYRQLLEYVRRRYDGAYWQPQPKRLAAWFEGVLDRRALRQELGAPKGGDDGEDRGRPAGLRGKRAAVLLYSYYPSDPRPRRAAEAMVDAGMSVDLLCLTENEGEPPRDVVNGVNVFRVPAGHRRGSKLSYLWNYGRFIAVSFWFLARRSLRRRYDVVHVHNMPDVLVFSALIPKLRGAGVILDLHDPMPELMMSIYGLKPGNWQIRVLRMWERLSLAFADVVLTPNITFKNLFVSRSCDSEKIHIVMNSPDESIFNPEPLKGGLEPRTDAGEFRVMHHGSIVHRHGIDLLVEAVARLRPKIPGIRLDIYGRRERFLDQVLAAAERLGVGDIVSYRGSGSQPEIARAILRSDLGVIPNRGSAFTGINFPTRIFEYLAMGRPIVVPATRGIRDYFEPGELPMFEQDNVDDLAAKILWVRENPEAVRAMLGRGMEVYRKHLWKQERTRFLNMVLAATRPG